MKKLFLPIVLGAALSLFTGCAGLSNIGQNVTTPVNVFTPEKTEKIVTFAARTGTRARLITHPQDRPLFEAAATALTDFENTTNATLADLARIVSTLPIKDLRDGDNGLYVDGGILLYDLTLGDQLAVDAELIRPVARGLKNGITQGLGRAKFQMRRATAMNQFFPHANQPRQLLTS